MEQAITPRTRAILVVHTFGVPAEMDSLASIARRRGFALIEDACESIGAEFDGRRVGSFGDLAVLGFYPNKQMTTGEGGAVLARDAEYAARLRKLRNQGRDASAGWLDQIEPGFNYRLSELACALGRVQLRRLDEMLTLRERAAERYDALLATIPGLERPPLELPRRKISWFVYVVRLPEGVDRERRAGCACPCKALPPDATLLPSTCSRHGARSLPAVPHSNPAAYRIHCPSYTGAAVFQSHSMAQQEQVADALRRALC